MSKEELVIDYDNYENNPSSFEDLKQAADNLANITQSQFEEIKKEKWFTRVFDIATFSKKNEKRMSSQISNLAQAQQIMMEIMVRLSSRDSRIFDLLSESFNKIEQLSENDILLAKKIKQLENSLVLGTSKQYDILDLSQTEREILSGILYYLMNEFEVLSEEQRQYAHNVLNYIEVEAREINVTSAIDSLELIDVKKKILTCSMEYIFLNNFTFDSLDNFNRIINNFDFGNKTIKEIINNTENMYRLRGKGGFIDKYDNYEYIELEDEFYIEFEEIEEENNEVEEITICSILNIPEGEVKVFKSKIIHINSYIHCKGSLIFDKCIIYYNEPNHTNEINISRNGSLEMKNCKVLCQGVSELFFIKANDIKSIILSNSTLQDCSSFIKVNSCETTQITIENCFIHHPNDCLLSGFGEKTIVTDCKIYINSDRKNLKDDIRFAMFAKNNSIFTGHSGKLRVEKSLIYSDYLDVIDGYVDPVFYASESIYESCSFININNCIQGAKKVSKSVFENCKDVISISKYCSERKIISDCIFEKCENVIRAEKTAILNCQFLKCKNSIIYVSFDGGVTVEFCEFYDLKCDINKSNDFFATACITLYRTKDNDSHYSTVKNCIFNGAMVENNFLIKGEIQERGSVPTGYIEDCTFKNCNSSRDSEKIIKQYATYFGLFNKKVEVKAIEINSCTGLDKVNKESTYVDSTIIEEVMSKKKDIGYNM